jgi:hypothetical protein
MRTYGRAAGQSLYRSPGGRVVMSEGYGLKRSSPAEFLCRAAISGLIGLQASYPACPMTLQRPPERRAARTAC